MRGKHEINHFFFARFQMDTFEATQYGFVSDHAAYLVANVELYYFVAGTFACIGYVYRYMHGALRIGRFLLDSEVGVIEGSVTQSVAKWVKSAIYTGISGTVRAAEVLSVLPGLNGKLNSICPIVFGKVTDKRPPGL